MRAFQTARQCPMCGHRERPKLFRHSLYIGYLFWPSVAATFAVHDLWPAPVLIFFWLLITPQVQCGVCERRFLKLNEVWKTYNKPSRKRFHFSRNRKSSESAKAGGPNAFGPDTESQEQCGDSNHRIFRCPSCTQSIRVPFPIPTGNGRCAICRALFEVQLDDAGNLYIYAKGQSSPGNRAQLTIEGCFAVLGISETATAETIKSAYKKMMKQYHPDKVSTLGEELRSLAEAKTKEINAAYKILKDKGHVN